ncbi:MAG: alpha/beta fold hydrolase [candidate division KSB1 bacterium]
MTTKPPSQFDSTNLLPFASAHWARGGDWQTLAGYLLPSPTHLPHTKLHHVEVSDGDLLALCENLPAQATPQGALLLLHGLGGHADSAYMLRIAARFLAHGWITFRLNHRGAGQGRGMAQRLYHAGKSDDLACVAQHAAQLHPHTPLVIAGFSLSANMLLKYLGESWQTPPANLCGAIAICPPLDLTLSSLAMRRLKNRLYDLRFVRMLKTAMRERETDFENFPLYPLDEVATVYDFDRHITAPHHGFLSAEDYYQRNSARQLLANLTLPTALIASDDDPFIPVESFANLPHNPALSLYLTRSGGHMGFIARTATPWGDRRWMDYAIAWQAQKFVRSVCENSPLEGGVARYREKEEYSECLAP